MATDTRLDFDELARLEEERRFLLRSLDDLEHEHDTGRHRRSRLPHAKDETTRRAVRPCFTPRSRPGRRRSLLIRAAPGALRSSSWGLRSARCSAVC